MAILIGVLLGICALAFVLTPFVHYPSRDEGGWVDGWGPLWASVRGKKKAEVSLMSAMTDDHKGPRLPPSSAPVPTFEDAQTTEREQSARNALQEIELDYQLGNISEADYTLLRERYMHRALVAMKSRYERKQELDAVIEEQLRHLKRQEEQRDAEE